MDWLEGQAQALQELQASLVVENWKWLKKSVDLQAPELSRVTTEDLRARYGQKKGINDARLIRCFVWQCWIKVRIGLSQPVFGNVRSFWYQSLEPFMRRHGLVESEHLPDDDGKESEAKPSGSRARWLAKLLEGCVAEFVGHRIFGYTGEFRFTAPLGAIGRVGLGRPSAMVYTEKEGLAWLPSFFYSGKIDPEDPVPPQLHLLGLHSRNPYGQTNRSLIRFPSISGLASHGQPSFLALECFAQTLSKKTKSLTIGAVCDLDPWGLQIVLSLMEKLDFLGFKVTAYLLTTYDLYTPEQLADGRDWTGQITPAEAPMFAHWLEVTGGLEGKPITLHADVAGPLKLILRTWSWLKLVLAGKPIPWPRLTMDDVRRFREKHPVPRSQFFR